MLLDQTIQSACFCGGQAICVLRGALLIEDFSIQLPLSLSIGGNGCAQTAEASFRLPKSQTEGA
jgi:hypothetical protein